MYVCLAVIKHVCVCRSHHVSHMPMAHDIEKPQCVLCYAVLSAESMKPLKLKRHLETKHPEHVKKDLDFFKGHSHNGGPI